MEQRKDLRSISLEKSLSRYPLSSFFVPFKSTDTVTTAPGFHRLFSAGRNSDFLTSLLLELRKGEELP
jgi:hypothetical protein